MDLTEDEILEKYVEKRGHFNGKTILPFECEFTCISCGFNLIKRKHELTRIQPKKSFIHRLKYAEHKFFCICVDVYRIYESEDFDKIYEVLSTIKNEKLKIHNILIEKYKDMNENQDFEQNYYSRTAIGTYKTGHDSIRLLEWLAYYDRLFLRKEHILI